MAGSSFTRSVVSSSRASSYSSHRGSSKQAAVRRERKLNPQRSKQGVLEPQAAGNLALAASYASSTASSICSSEVSLPASKRQSPSSHGTSSSGAASLASALRSSSERRSVASSVSSVSSVPTAGRPGVETHYPWHDRPLRARSLAHELASSHSAGSFSARSSRSESSLRSRSGVSALIRHDHVELPEGNHVWHIHQDNCWQKDPPRNPKPGPSPAEKATIRDLANGFTDRVAYLEGGYFQTFDGAAGGRSWETTPRRKAPVKTALPSRSREVLQSEAAQLEPVAAGVPVSSRNSSLGLLWSGRGKGKTSRSEGGDSTITSLLYGSPAQIEEDQRPLVKQKSHLPMARAVAKVSMYGHESPSERATGMSVNHSEYGDDFKRAAGVMSSRVQRGLDVVLENQNLVAVKGCKAAGMGRRPSHEHLITERTPSSDATRNEPRDDTTRPKKRMFHGEHYVQDHLDQVLFNVPRSQSQTGWAGMSPRGDSPRRASSASSRRSSQPPMSQRSSSTSVVAPWNRDDRDNEVSRRFAMPMSAR
eukprot:TRINITY_DN20953_c0_g1_i3.p1 TRINITY_DN20953_c0_g1~~TRINITY_DN20953_c0_g1_i3.p1  ORF type:complete len:547 (+),score=58.58 TRINITY_DN20953_c0_g1_i3:38-1642(+)